MSLPDVKTWLVVEHNQDDAFLTRLITQVRAAIERKTKISLVPKTVVLTADLYCECKLPRGPIVSVDEVAVKGTDANYSAVASSEYSTDGELFKLFRSNRVGRQRVTYTVGYGNEDLPVPEDLKLAMLEEITYRYEHKGDEDKLGGFSPSVMSHLKNHINYAWA